jgi:hypothetical protein
MAFIVFRSLATGQGRMSHESNKHNIGEFQNAENNKMCYITLQYYVYPLQQAF